MQLYVHTMERIEVIKENQYNWTQLLQLCHNHINHFNSELKRPEQLLSVTTEWVQCFEEHNLEARGAGGFTRGDILYVLRCYLLVAQSGHTYATAKSTHIKQILYYVYIWSIHHAQLQAELTWPAPEFLQFVENVAADLVVFTLSSEAPPQDIGALKPASEEVMAKLELLAIVKRWNEKEEDFAKRLPPEYGTYWPRTPEDSTKVFVAMCSRVLHQIHLHNHWIKEYPHYVMHQKPVTNAHRERFMGWMKEKCVIELSDAFIRLYRSTCLEYMLPLGSRLISSRSALANKEESLYYLEELLGFEVAANIQSYLEMPMKDIIADEKNLFHDMLILLLFHYFLSHNTGGTISFLNNYVIMHYEVATKATALLPLLKQHVFLDRTPIIANLQKRWWIHNVLPKPRWIPCDSLTDAILLWVMFVHKQYNGTVGDFISIENFILQFV